MNRCTFPHCVDRPWGTGPCPRGHEGVCEAEGPRTPLRHVLAFGVVRKARCKSLNAPVGDDTDTTIQDQLADPKSEEGFEAVDEAEDRANSRAALNWLTPKEARVLELRFGLERSPVVSEDSVMARIRAIEARARRGVAAAA